MDIPIDLINMVIEATSKFNDGWRRQVAIRQLQTWRDYIDNVLKGIEGKEENKQEPKDKKYEG